MCQETTPPETEEPARTRGIVLGRLPDVPLDLLVAHMSDARMADHMPLLTFAWTREVAAGFVAAKEACWARDGLGHWAIFHDGRYVGWGGFQKEDGEWDFGLVLRPDAFGLGTSIARKALRFARGDDRIPYVTFLLPRSRRRLGALARLGAQPLGEVDYDGARFQSFGDS